jgi:hypothetical protein
MSVREKVVSLAVERLDFETRRPFKRLDIAARSVVARGNLPKLATICGTDKWNGHWYAKHYETHLRHLRWKPVNVLEIGIGGYTDPQAGGHSLRMWKQFFPRGRIFGLDLFDKSPQAEKRIKIYQGDQSDPELLKRIVSDIGRVDIAIDDGSHHNAHVLATFETLFPLLPSGAMYVIEDTQTAYWPEFGGSLDLNASDTSMALAKRLIDGLNYMEFLDEDYVPTYTDLNVTAVHCYHNMIFIEKGDNREGTNKRETLVERFGGS